MAGEVAIKDPRWRGKRDQARLTKALELDRSESGEGNCLDDLQLPFVRLERVLIELVNVLKQPSGSRQATAVRARRVGGVTRSTVGWSLPVIHLNIRRNHLLSLEG